MKRLSKIISAILLVMMIGLIAYGIYTKKKETLIVGIYSSIVVIVWFSILNLVSCIKSKRFVLMSIGFILSSVVLFLNITVISMVKEIDVMLVERMIIYEKLDSEEAGPNRSKLLDDYLELSNEINELIFKSGMFGLSASAFFSITTSLIKRKKPNEADDEINIITNEKYE
jgi:hypothetical protein